MNKGFTRRWQRSVWLLTIALLLVASNLRAAEVIPAKPTRYFNDYALTVKPETADRLNNELQDFEKQTSNQLLVVIYPTMQSESDVAEYCHRIFATWHVGQEGKDNGAVLFVFVKEHHAWIEVNRGLEGSLPDATCKDITADKITPSFKAGDYDGGLTAGVEAMIAATKGEYKGSGQTAHQRNHPRDSQDGQSGGLGLGTIIFVIALFFIVSRFFNRRGGGGGTLFGGGPPIILPGGFGGSFGGGGFGGGSSDGGGGSSDGGGFFDSGGGGSGAGGGAGSDW